MQPEPAGGKCELETLVCFALDREAAPFRKIARGIPGVSILVTGVGSGNAEASLRKFLAGHRVKQVFTCGFAGGLNPQLAAGDVVFMTGYPGMEKRLAAAGARLAGFFTARRIAITVAEKKKLREETAADVVEMESGAILEICRLKQIPCAMVRAVSDTANEDLPLDFNRLAKPDMSIDLRKLAWTVAISPGRIPALMQLQKQTRLAAGQLAAVLAKIISP